ncbi:MAG: hypothetical protein NVS4B2_29290 [Chloroflexota bacterium]
MNPWYSLMESPYRWQYLAAATFTVGCVGAMMMIAYVWPANLARVWFYGWTLGSIYSIVRAVLEWRTPPNRDPIQRQEHRPTSASRTGNSSQDV